MNFPSSILFISLLVLLNSNFINSQTLFEDLGNELEPQWTSGNIHHYYNEAERSHSYEKRSWGVWNSKLYGKTKLSNAGFLNIGGMQVSVVDDDSIIVFDKAEHNPLMVNGHNAWGAIYSISKQTVRPLNLQTNSFCAGGSWLGNGTLVSIGGNPQENPSSPPSGNGIQSIRLFTPCNGGSNCDIYENPSRLHLTSNRWYPSAVRVSDGSVLILGGMTAGGFNNAPATDNPTFEFWPPKGNGKAIYSKFLHDALNTNLFPVTFFLTDDTVFVAANRLAMIYNWRTNTETRLPGIPNGVRINYPSSSAAVLLPLTIANGFTPEVLMCGGSTANVDGSPNVLSSQTPASKQCIRMVLNAAGISKGWQVEQMPEARIMGDAILTPDGKVVIVNGAQTGVAGYGNVQGEIGQSNAANPVFHATIYDLAGKPGRRFSTNFPSSTTERLYHSSATLLPDGRIWLGGSNPNADVSTTTYITRYNVEILTPPYVHLARPVITTLPSKLGFGNQYTLSVTIPAGAQVITAVIMDLGYSTHGVHSTMRNVELVIRKTGTSSVVITGPKSALIYPPGYAWLYILADGVPSKGRQILVGSGASPPQKRSIRKKHSSPRI